MLDCIDTVSAKLLLIRCCKKDGVPILCSMGAANKLDPTAFRVADIEKTTVDPLAKVIRLECRKRRLGKVKVVFSEEQTLPPLQEEIEEAPTAARRTVPASNAFVPAGWSAGPRSSRTCCARPAFTAAKNNFSAPRWHKSGAFCMKNTSLPPVLS